MCIAGVRRSWCDLQSENALAHKVGDVVTLIGHLDLLDRDRRLLQTLPTASLSSDREITWSAAG
jgi:hypothetical protein